MARKTRTVAMAMPTNMARSKRNSAESSLFLEDVEGNEYKILDKRRRSWSDETPVDTARQEMFFKQGNAEILRIMSNDSLEVMDSASNLGAFNAFDELAGKKAIMNKFLNSKPDATGEQLEHDGDVGVNRDDKIQNRTEEAKKETTIEEEQKKMTAFQRDVLLTK